MVFQLTKGLVASRAASRRQEWRSGGERPFRRWVRTSWSNASASPDQKLQSDRTEATGDTLALMPIGRSSRRTGSIGSQAHPRLPHWSGNSHPHWHGLTLAVQHGRYPASRISALHGAIPNSIGSKRDDRAMSRYRRDRDATSLERTMAELDTEQAAAEARRPAESVPADVAVRYVRELPETWHKAEWQGPPAPGQRTVPPDRCPGLSARRQST